MRQQKNEIEERVGLSVEVVDKRKWPRQNIAAIPKYMYSMYSVQHLHSSPQQRNISKAFTLRGSMANLTLVHDPSSAPSANPKRSMALKVW
jgi:hypothetical protein